MTTNEVQVTQEKAENLNWPLMHPVEGFFLGTAHTNTKYQGRDDLVLLCFEPSASVAGVFTKNAFAAAPVHIAKAHLQSEACRAFVINAGNANACTGQAGHDAAQAICQGVADQQCYASSSAVLPFSTGVIGEVLDARPILNALPKAIGQLSETQWQAAGRAIMTTDTRAKGTSVQFSWQGEVITITGIAKGSGMIEPNMATMLAFIATDAGVSKEVISELSQQLADASFNRISVDGDTSTNDACMLVATGKRSACLQALSGDFYDAFYEALLEVYQSLAHKIVWDGEGATKFVAVTVKNGQSAEECCQAAYSIARSPLVKTALFASDANWGRIVMALGNADIPLLDTRLVDIYLGDVLIVESGGRASTYTEAQGAAVLARSEVTITVDLKRGDVCDTVWTSDLSHEYIRINAEYRS